MADSRYHPETRQSYSLAVARLLGEALTAYLTSTSKFFKDGIYPPDQRRQRPVRMLIADTSSDGVLRGYIGYDTDGIAKLDGQEPSAVRLFGGGHIAFTVDQDGAFELLSGHCRIRGLESA